MFDATDKELDELEEQAKKTNFVVPVSPETLLKLIGDLRMWRNCILRPDTSHLLQWTTKTPTEEGWYWNRVAGKATIIVKLYYDSNGEFYYRVAGLPDDPECQWAGPIPEPEEQK